MPLPSRQAFNMQTWKQIWIMRISSSPVASDRCASMICDGSQEKPKCFKLRNLNTLGGLAISFLFVTRNKRTECQHAQVQPITPSPIQILSRQHSHIPRTVKFPLQCKPYATVKPNTINFAKRSFAVRSPKYCPAAGRRRLLRRTKFNTELFRTRTIP